jgi:hypothetical protein
MRVFLAVCLAVLSAPAVAETRISVIAETAEAATDASVLVKALLAGLAGDHAGCPVYLDANGELPLLVSHMPGPPPGWSVSLGAVEAPDFAASGAAGDMSAAAAGILEKLCPKQGGASTAGPWTASGGGARITVSGEVANLLAPFTLEGAFPGGTAVFEYTPVNIGGGPVSYTLSGSGVTGSGEGIYALTALPNGVYELVQTTDGCVDGIAGSCRTNTETIILTPIGQ